MLKSNTAIRLKEIMEIKGLRQIDILNKSIPYCQKYGVKLTKGDLSQYLSGKHLPMQNKLYILSQTLEVNEAWLMGYDVPMEPTEEKPYQSAPDISDTPQILQKYNTLNSLGKLKADDYITDLSENPKYTE